MQHLLPAVQFDAQLLQQYDQPVPRYTSYPPATELKPEFEDVDFRASIAVSNYKKTPLSLYCHIPFCDSACYFCGCNTVITQRKELAEHYLGYLVRHIQQMAQLIDGDRRFTNCTGAEAHQTIFRFNKLKPCGHRFISIFALIQMLKFRLKSIPKRWINTIYPR